MTDDQFYRLLQLAATLLGTMLFGRFVLGPLLMAVLR